MSVAPPSCPAREELEAAALAAAPEPRLSDHLTVCADCRTALERIREDNRFLSGFAIDGALPAARANPASFEIDIPGYQIRGEIHRGGQGVVYQAIQESTRRAVAIKIMRQGPFATLADRARFEREIETLGRLDHPNIVAVHDAGVAAGFHYFVMDYIEGRQLDEWVGGVDQRTRIQTFAIVCDAVHAAHLRGIIHRDLKPGNIRIDNAGAPHVLDFGLAKPADAAADSAMTRTGQFVGSLPWASPEQVEGVAARVDLRTDVYSLGVILFQLLTGALPFDVGSNLHEALNQILQREPPRPSARRSAGQERIGDELDTIVLHCLSKDPQRRYQSAGELATDLRRYLAGEAIDAKRDNAFYVLRKTLRRYRLRVAAAAAFLILLVLFSGVMAVLYRRSNRLEHAATHSAVALGEALVQSNIEQGRLAGMLGNIEQAETLLWREFLTERGPGQHDRLQTPPGRPQAYWALWELYRRQPFLRTFETPGGTASVTVSDDGHNLWAIGRDGIVRLLDSRGKQLEAHPALPGPQKQLPVVDATGAVVLMLGAKMSLWRRGAPEPLLEFDPVSNFDTGGACISASGTRFALIQNGAVIVWGLAPLQESARLNPEGTAYTGVAISRNEKLIAARDRLGGIQVWEIEGLRLLRSAPPTLSREPIHNFGSLVFSADDGMLADAWECTPGRIWDLRSEAPTAIELAERPGTHRNQCFSPDGRLLAVADTGGVVRIFDVATGRREAAFIAHSGRVFNIGFTGDGRGLWTGNGGQVRLWEVVPDAAVRVLRVEGESFHSAAFAPDGQSILAGNARGQLHRFDLAGAPQGMIELQPETIVSSVTISANGARTAVSTYGNAAFLWDSFPIAGTPRRLAHPHRLSHACFSADGERLATTCDDQKVRIWRCSDGALEHEFGGMNDRVPQAAFAPDGRLLAAAVRDGSLIVWDTHSGRREDWASPSNERLRSVCFSPEGRAPLRLVAAGASRTVDIWDCTGRQRIARLAGHNQEIFALDISRTGLIASGDTGGTIRLWDLEHQRALATLDGHTEAVMSLKFSPDGARLLSTSLDGTARIWDLNYYATHIAGNLEMRLSRLEATSHDARRAGEWRDWASSVLAGHANRPER